MTDTSSNPSLFNANFLHRTLTSLILGGLVVWLLVTQSAFVAYLCGGLAFLMIGEWAFLIFNARKSQLQKLVWLGSGTFYIVFGMMGFFQMYEYSYLLALSVLTVIWGTDIGAYIVGRLVGGKKLAPRISPNKTWSGSIGGLVTALVMGIFFSAYAKGGVNFYLISFYCTCSIAGQLGDLLESAVKRYFNVKDMSRLLPGHGGVIDRLDSLLFIGNCLYLLQLIAGEGLFQLQ